MSGSVLTARILEPASDSVTPSLSQINVKKNFFFLKRMSRISPWAESLNPMAGLFIREIFDTRGTWDTETKQGREAKAGMGRRSSQ